MISIAMFNNKGGVGKTTLTCNLASYLAMEREKRVLVVDCDPQCNSTQLIMGEERTTDFYWNPGEQLELTTIRDILKPIEEGDSNIRSQVLPLSGDNNRFGVDLIPGHPGFSVIEDILGAAWHDLRASQLGGFRKTNWNTQLCCAIEQDYDIAFYDLGPSLGSINRTVLIGCDKFMTPMASDIFSILGLRNIAIWLDQWVRVYKEAVHHYSMSESAKSLSKYPVKRALDITRGYCGYTMQQYITKSMKGKRRPTRAYDKIINKVPQELEESLGKYFTSGLTLRNANMGDLPHLYSLIPLAQSVASPVLRLKAADGLVGAQFRQREQYSTMISTIATNLLKNLYLE